MKRLLKNNHGMTLMEILVALTLLMIVIVGTTPVMLSAFDGLYTAGEYTQDTYQAKSEVEEKLATRNTKDVYNPGFQVNFNNIGEVANINARRAVSSLYGSLETLFSNGKVHVSIVSAKTVNDDLPTIASTDPDDYYEVIIQTTNLDFGDDVKNKFGAAAKVSLNNESKVEDGNKDCEKIIDLTFIIPDKTQDGEGKIYSYKDKKNHARIYKDTNGNECEADPITGRIKVRINGFDFTQSPIKIRASYLDENYKKKTTETYLFVEQPTIIAAGETGTYHYYTSPGVLQTKQIVTENGKEVTKTTENFGLYGRTMRLNTFTQEEFAINFYNKCTPKIESGVYSIPAGTIFKSVNWITEDESSVLNPYYVLTGTNGAIYRTYSFKGFDESTFAELSGVDQRPDATAAAKRAKYKFDTTITLKDRTATTVYPALWGGDTTHQFGYATYEKAMGYSGSDKCWYTSVEEATNDSFENFEANPYSTKAKYSYYYNGHTTAFTYMTQNSRKISYILTETGNAMRRGGLMNGIGDFGEYYNKIWENFAGKTERASGNAWYHSGNDDVMFQTPPIYFTGGSRGGGLNDLEEGFAQIRIKYLTTNSPYSMATQKRYKSENAFSSNMWLNSDMYTSNVTVTDAVYIPTTSKMSGKMFYVGTVSANALINQTDAVFENANQTSWEEQSTDDWRYAGYRTAYAVFGNAAEETTSVYKFMYTQNHHEQSADSYEWFFENSTSTLYSGGKTSDTYNPYISGTGVEVNSKDGHEFYVYRYVPGGDRSNVAVGTNSCLFNDVQFTMGFASDRAMAYSQIAYGVSDGNVLEAYKGCEPYYFLSHWGDSSHIPTLFMSTANGNYISALTAIETANQTGKTGSQVNEQYFNSYNNDYYNVWFPGEMYNLTKVATKDGVTVSVGYAVAGSTYQFVDPREDSNTSTALGGIYNDGVLSAMIGGVDSSLTNLLYYKDNDTFDNYSLSTTETDKSAGYNYKNYNGDNFERYTGAKRHWLTGKITGYNTDKVGQTDYNLYDTKGYGTHTRDSIQFTAVDIGVQRVVTGTTEKATYYAYYADNKGRVFRSKVAVKSSSVPNDYDPDAENANQNVEVKSLKKVDYISDVIVQSGDTKLTDDTIGYMEQLKPTGINFTDLFDKITTLKIDGKMIFISGKPKQGSSSLSGIPVVVGMVNDETNTIKWTVVYMQVSGGSYTSYWIEDMIVLGDYFYTVGQKGTKGFMTAIPTSMLRVNLDKATPSSSCIFTQTVDTTFGNELYIEEVDQRLYTVAGK